MADDLSTILNHPLVQELRDAATDAKVGIFEARETLAQLPDYYHRITDAVNAINAALTPQS